MKTKPQIDDNTASRGQVSLEVGFALLATFILLLGSFVIFGWLNTRLVYRQEQYETGPQGRVAAGLTNSEVIVDEESMPAMQIFK